MCEALIPMASKAIVIIFSLLVVDPACATRMRDSDSSTEGCKLNHSPCGYARCYSLHWPSAKGAKECCAQKGYTVCMKNYEEGVGNYYVKPDEIGKCGNDAKYEAPDSACEEMVSWDVRAGKIVKKHIPTLDEEDEDE